MEAKKHEDFDWDNLFDILDFIEEKHFLLLKPRLELLYTYLSGIEFVSYGQNVDIKKLEEFSRFLHQKIELEHENTMGWYGALANKYGTEREGFDKFFEYLSEFRKEY